MQNSLQTLERPSDHSNPLHAEGLNAESGVVRKKHGRILDTDGRKVDEMARIHNERVQGSREKLNAIGDHLGERILRIVARIDEHSIDDIDNLEKSRLSAKKVFLRDEVESLIHYYENEESYIEAAAQEAALSGHTITIGGEKHLGIPEEEIPEWRK